jgi:trk system potassium uptake protein
LKIVIVGAGEVGFHIASRLSLENKEVVLVDKDAAAIRRVADSMDVQTIVPAAAAARRSWRMPVSATPRSCWPSPTRMKPTWWPAWRPTSCRPAPKSWPASAARISMPTTIFRQQTPHIDTVINPEIEVVKTIERLMRVPGAVDVGEFAEGRIKFVGVYLDKDARLAGVRSWNCPKDRAPAPC